MSLSKFGVRVREFRRSLGVTLSSMATALDTSPAFLSAMETGRSKIPMEWVDKISSYFEKSGMSVNRATLKASACEDNESVSLVGLPPHHRMLIAGFANSDLNQEQLAKLGRLLSEIHGETTDHDGRKSD
ncbi:helix-turn-helix transcriptional regulator [Pseudomonas sp. D6002]|uniref:helix-turn-helix domain-containing protein n=1 Tax=unclassified Pseudomonas TaxID=196821 RepID=UPI0015A2143D|nr:MULTISPECIES: helix-turn-helix transcriptional regulator [unclassified Pseudomonas]NVZ95251.1 helix-turn-helix transcriptional regulator [Pseudomonas sp. B6001]NWB18383.1 helix-turn-helix transcriptional regulator [Pseudomonas sp. D6002]NWB63732.1 helix-turn-helix transcriptional regulator [Pseudomonas sp. F1002]